VAVVSVDFEAMGTSPTESRPTIDDVLTPARRAELTGFCYRMLGSAFDAEDAVQETLTRAWRSYDRFEGRSEVRTWLYRIASNVCFDALRGRKRRALPMEMTAATRAADGLIGTPLPESAFVEPTPGNTVSTHPSDPADAVAERESIRLAFVAALQHLPPQQRAVLILRDVLKWQAREVAELLDTTVAGVNSALQRAHATLANHQLTGEQTEDLDDEAKRALLAKYVDAFERYDIEALTSLIAADATQSMPPWAMWLRGRDEILEWWQGPGAECRDSRLIATEANGTVAFGQYKPDPAGGRAPWSLQVLRLDGDRIAEFTFFLDVARMFPLFGLPAHL
jgi:RNA polymerase sigma-70 factor, ECF subfamily